MCQLMQPCAGLGQLCVSSCSPVLAWLRGWHALLGVDPLSPLRVCPHGPLPAQDNHMQRQARTLCTRAYMQAYTSKSWVVLTCTHAMLQALSTNLMVCFCLLACARSVVCCALCAYRKVFLCGGFQQALNYRQKAHACGLHERCALGVVGGYVLLGTLVYQVPNRALVTHPTHTHTHTHAHTHTHSPRKSDRYLQSGLVCANPLASVVPSTTRARACVCVCVGHIPCS